MPKAKFVNTGDDGPDEQLEDIARTEHWIAAGAPSMAELWERAQGTFAEPPLTVKQAAQRANVHEKTIRRRLEAWAALEPPAAWQFGKAWRISTDALELMRMSPPQSSPQRTQRRKRTQSGSDSEMW